MIVEQEDWDSIGSFSRHYCEHLQALFKEFGIDTEVQGYATGNDATVYLPTWLAIVYRRAEGLAGNNADWKRLAGPYTTATGSATSDLFVILQRMLRAVEPATYEAAWRLGGRAAMNRILVTLGS